MANMNLIATFALFCICCFTLGQAGTKAVVTVQATNNTQVPSVIYIVNAVEALQEAYSIYENDTERASLYSALFEEKHPGIWNVVVGYTTFYINSSIYIETLVSDGKEKSSKGGDELFLIFSSD